MRSPAEIVSRIEKMFDPLHWQTEVLVDCLPFEYARPWLARETRRRDWHPTTTEEAVREAIQVYAAHGWRMIAAHRSVPCNRTIERVIGWLYAVGADDLLVLMMEQPFQHFGAPRLAVVCRAYGFPIPDDLAIKRMIDSLPCREGCDRGCGRLPEFSEVIGKTDSEPESTTTGSDS